jgi:predicted RNA-binding Zn-ribbon protein involved in translation (DUF1610 family)
MITVEGKIRYLYLLEQFPFVESVTILDCWACGEVWFQRAEEAMARPLEPCRCPKCGELFVAPWHRADEPVIVERLG